MKRILLATLLLCTPAAAHDHWADGSVVPEWVKGQCCGPAEAHRLTVDQVREMEDGWHIDGLRNVVPRSNVFPSQDGHYWGFYDDTLGEGAYVHCFFVPESM